MSASSGTQDVGALCLSTWPCPFVATLLGHPTKSKNSASFAALPGPQPFLVYYHKCIYWRGINRGPGGGGGGAIHIRSYVQSRLRSTVQSAPGA